MRDKDGWGGDGDTPSRAKSLLHLRDRAPAQHAKGVEPVEGEEEEDDEEDDTAIYQLRPDMDDRGDEDDGYDEDEDEDERPRGGSAFGPCGSSRSATGPGNRRSSSDATVVLAAEVRVGMIWCARRGQIWLFVAPRRVSGRFRVYVRRGYPVFGSRPV